MKALQETKQFIGTVDFDAERRLQSHRARIRQAKAHVDTKTPDSMIKFVSPSIHPNRRVLEKNEERARIARDNMGLAKRIFTIMEKPGVITAKLNEYKKVEVHPGTMNFATRLHKAHKIHRENLQMADRLDHIKSQYQKEAEKFNCTSPKKVSPRLPARTKKVPLLELPPVLASQVEGGNDRIYMPWTSQLNGYDYEYDDGDDDYDRYDYDEYDEGYVSQSARPQNVINSKAPLTSRVYQPTASAVARSARGKIESVKYQLEKRANVPAPPAQQRGARGARSNRQQRMQYEKYVGQDEEDEYDDYYDDVRSNDKNTGRAAKSQYQYSTDDFNYEGEYSAGNEGQGVSEYHTQKNITTARRTKNQQDSGDRKNDDVVRDDGNRRPQKHTSAPMIIESSVADNGTTQVAQTAAAAATHMFKPDASKRPRKVLLEYTKIQSGRVIDTIVMKEPFHDRFAVYGIDVMDGQRFELRLSSEEATDILDGDMIVTSVENIPVWLALLKKVDLPTVDAFTKLIPEESDEIASDRSNDPLVKFATSKQPIIRPVPVQAAADMQAEADREQGRRQTKKSKKSSSSTAAAKGASEQQQKEEEEHTATTTAAATAILEGSMIETENSKEGSESDSSPPSHKKSSRHHRHRDHSDANPTGTTDTHTDTDTVATAGIGKEHHRHEKEHEVRRQRQRDDEAAATAAVAAADNDVTIADEDANMSSMYPGNKAGRVGKRIRSSRPISPILIDYGEEEDATFVEGESDIQYNSNKADKASSVKNIVNNGGGGGRHQASRPSKKYVNQHTTQQRQQENSDPNLNLKPVPGSALENLDEEEDDRGRGNKKGGDDENKKGGDDVNIKTKDGEGEEEEEIVRQKIAASVIAKAVRRRASVHSDRGADLPSSSATKTLPAPSLATEDDNMSSVASVRNAGSTAGSNLAMSVSMAADAAVATAADSEFGDADNMYGEDDYENFDDDEDKPTKKRSVTAKNSNTTATAAVTATASVSPQVGKKRSPGQGANGTGDDVATVRSSSGSSSGRRRGDASLKEEEEEKERDDERQGGEDSERTVRIQNAAEIEIEIEAEVVAVQRPNPQPPAGPRPVPRYLQATSAAARKQSKSDSTPLPAPRPSRPSMTTPLPFAAARPKQTPVGGDATPVPAGGISSSKEKDAKPTGRLLRGLKQQQQQGNERRESLGGRNAAAAAGAASVNTKQQQQQRVSSINKIAHKSANPSATTSSGVVRTGRPPVDSASALPAPAVVTKFASEGSEMALNDITEVAETEKKVEEAASVADDEESSAVPGVISENVNIDVLPQVLPLEDEIATVFKFLPSDFKIAQITSDFSLAQAASVSAFLPPMLSPPCPPAVGIIDATILDESLFIEQSLKQISCIDNSGGADHSTRNNDDIGGGNIHSDSINSNQYYPGEGEEEGVHVLEIMSPPARTTEGGGYGYGDEDSGIFSALSSSVVKTIHTPFGYISGGDDLNCSVSTVFRFFSDTTLRTPLNLNFTSTLTNRSPGSMDADRSYLHDSLVYSAILEEDQSFIEAEIEDGRLIVPDHNTSAVHGGGYGHKILEASDRSSFANDRSIDKKNGGEKEIIATTKNMSNSGSGIRDKRQQQQQYTRPTPPKVSKPSAGTFTSPSVASAASRRASNGGRRIIVPGKSDGNKAPLGAGASPAAPPSGSRSRPPIPTGRR